MERLTVFDGEFWVHKNFPPVGEDTIDEFIDCVKELAARLAAYEDTGLEPDDIKRVFNEDAVLNLAGQALGITPDRLRELAQADREGRCVMLPAKTVFELTWDAGPNCNMICPLSIDGKGQCDFCDYGEQFIYESPCRQEHIDQIGKTVFLSREEAEKALEGMKYA